MNTAGPNQFQTSDAWVQKMQEQRYHRATKSVTPSYVFYILTLYLKYAIKKYIKEAEVFTWRHQKPSALLFIHKCWAFYISNASNGVKKNQQ